MINTYYFYVYFYSYLRVYLYLYLHLMLRFAIRLTLPCVFTLVYFLLYLYVHIKSWLQLGGSARRLAHVLAPPPPPFNALETGQHVPKFLQKFQTMKSSKVWKNIKYFFKKKLNQINGSIDTTEIFLFFFFETRGGLCGDNPFVSGSFLSRPHRQTSSRVLALSTC